ncbi:MAG TPA: ATP-binding protein [Terriglobales bacterium]|nr:ATP-binding protein [Terriglobales bacterium]
MPGLNVAPPDFGNDRMVMRLETGFAADVEEIAPVVERVMAVAGTLSFPEEKQAEIGLALQEALANAVIHGCKRDRSKMVYCWVASDPLGNLVIVVRDSGPGFDPAAVPKPNIGEGLYADHGRGIFMIGRLMDDVRFAREGTELHMRKDNRH